MKVREQLITETPRAARTMLPSSGLMTAALAGLLGVGGCGDDDKDPNWVCEPPVTQGNDAGSAQAVADAAATPADTGAPIQDAETPVMDAAADAASADAGDSGPVGPISQEPVVADRTLASLTADCDTRGGYMQVHAACAGANDCKGFSYYSGSPPGQLTEHTCAGANSCTGVSCVVGPVDTNKTGKEVYEQKDYPPGGPASCLNCHAIWGLKDANGMDLPPDSTKFRLWVFPGSARNETNWLDLTADAQEQILAFGKMESFPDGLTLQSMRGYHALWSRAEIKRAVEHIRTLTPVLSEIKRPQ